MLKSLFCEDISVEYELLNQRNLRGVSIDLKLNNLDLSRNTTELKTLPTRPRAHRYDDIYIDLYIRDRICQNLSS